MIRESDIRLRRWKPEYADLLNNCVTIDVHKSRDASFFSLNAPHVMTASCAVTTSSVCVVRLHVSDPDA
jgi:hypothetical protein